MALPVSEFIHFQLKSSVKPEDPSNEEGQALLQLFQTAKHQSGYKSSAWGRTVEDENIVVWVVSKFPPPLPLPLPKVKKKERGNPTQDKKRKHVTKQIPQTGPTRTKEFNHNS